MPPAAQHRKRRRAISGAEAGTKGQARNGDGPSGHEVPKALMGSSRTDVAHSVGEQSAGGRQLHDSGSGARLSNEQKCVSLVDFNTPTDASKSKEKELQNDIF